jgi:hypothetical protein
MIVELRSYWLPKAGNSLDEYEDSFWPKELPAEADIIRLAVADGATETSFAGSWAQLLTTAYSSGQLAPENIKDSLPGLEKIWRLDIGQKPLPWYAEEKLEAGAFAAIAGIELCAKSQSWTGFAIGDCCGFHTRGELILKSFPLSDADQFNDRPLLLSSVARNNRGVLESVTTVADTWERGDTFFLMSDALAAWFLRFARLPASGAVDCLKAIRSQEDFASFIERYRKENGDASMKNDDVTLMSCTVA